MLILAAAGPVSAAEPGWQTKLTRQLAAEEGCTVAFYSQISVVRQNGREIIAARAHCEDRRAFDATRISPAEVFDLRECATSGDERTC